MKHPKSSTATKIQYRTTTGTTRLVTPHEPAYHEAGHTVVGWALGWEPVLVTIDPEFPRYQFKLSPLDQIPLSKIPASLRGLYVKNKLAKFAAGVAAQKRRRPNGSLLFYWLNYGMGDSCPIGKLALRMARQKVTGLHQRH